MSGALEPIRPLPKPDRDDSTWWEALQDGRVLLARCGLCSGEWMRPSPRCPYCGADRVGLHDVEHPGTVYTWVVVHRALDPSFAAEVPYTIVLASVGNGARIFARLLGPSEGLHVGASVHLTTYGDDGPQLVGARLMIDEGEAP